MNAEINLISLIEQYSDETKCRQYIEALRWEDGVKCPRCGSDKISHIKKRDQYDCDKCRYQFSATAGTIFHDSHLPLWKWFLAVYLMTESKKGMSANQLQRSLGVSYKTAWYLCHRIRKTMEEDLNAPKLKGTIEVDETYIGGAYDKRRKRAPWDKPAVVGLLQRNGRFEARAIPSASKKVLVGIVKERVSNKAIVMTDEKRAYQSLDKEFRHKSINHGEEEWARGNVTTNHVENAWSLFKRSLVGSYHQISAKHLNAYLDEFEWRFNNRNNQYLFRDTIIKLLNAPKMEFKKLVA